MGTIRKVIGALLLVTAILVTQIPAVETSAAPNSDFQIDKTKLVKYTGTATSVSIPSTVKTIGAEAFAGNTTLTSISIGVVLSEERHFGNILEIGEVGAQVKHVAKSITGSCYAINRRRD